MIRGVAPTPRGVGLLAATVALLVAGFALGYPELPVLGAAGLIALACALCYAVWQPRLGVARVADPDRVPRGEASTLTLTVSNVSKLRSATLVADDTCGTRSVPVPVLRLRPRRDTTVSYPVPTDRRGVVLIGPLRVTRRDPLGLIGMTRRQGGAARVWVYPKIHQLTAVPPGVARSLDGRIDRVPHGSITFDTLREYVVGDELRHVHWRTTAKVGELMVREHLDTSLPRLVVLLDDRATSHPDVRHGVAETFESACEAAASVVAAAFREDLPIVLHLVSEGTVSEGTVRESESTPAGRGTSRSTRKFLDLLAEAMLHADPGAIAGSGPADGAQPRTGRSWKPQGALYNVTSRLRQQRVGDTLVYLTGPGGREDLGLVSALRGSYPSVVVTVFGEASPDSPAGGSASIDAGLVVLDAADGTDFAAEWDRLR